MICQIENAWLRRLCVVVVAPVVLIIFAALWIFVAVCCAVMGAIEGISQASEKAGYHLDDLLDSIGYSWKGE